MPILAVDTNMKNRVKVNEMHLSKEVFRTCFLLILQFWRSFRFCTKELLAILLTYVFVHGVLVAC